MDTPVTKSQLLELIRRERAAWEALLADVGEMHMIQPGVAGDWSFKDVAAHLTAWRQRAVNRLKAAQRGEHPAPAPWTAEVDAAEDDPINDWIYRANRDRPLADVLRESRESLEQLEAAVQVLSEQDLTDPQRFPWMGGVSLSESILGNSMDHFHGDHEPAIRAWLAGLSN
jgi:hypothetical protein